jgi:hypothetical protein
MSSIQISDYVYLKGSPEMSFFDHYGQSLDLLEILPRNRSYGAVPEQSNTIAVTYPVYTSISSLRAMNLTLTDETGDPIKFGAPYLIKIEIVY